MHPMKNVFSPLLTKPSVLTASTTSATPSSTLANHVLPTHSHTLPSVLLPSTGANTTNGASIGLFGKRKLADSFLGDDDDNFLMMDDGPTSSMSKLPKSHATKRPRVLDMNKVRSVVLGGGSNSQEITRKNEENPSDTFLVKPATIAPSLPQPPSSSSSSSSLLLSSSSLSSSNQLSGWKQFATYDAYLASKKPIIEAVDKLDNNKTIIETTSKFERNRAHCLPRLTHDDYYTNPSIDELHPYFNEQGQCFVQEFTVGREHYGSVTFQGARINLAGLDLDRLSE
jgi:hypothetical protein